MDGTNTKLIFIVLTISALMTVVTMYIFGAWQHNRYWDGTMNRVNEIESSVYQNLLAADFNDIFSKRNFDELKGVFEPLDGKLLIRLIDQNGSIVFDNAKESRKLGRTIQESQIKFGSEKFTVQFIRYKPPSWSKEYGRWFLSITEWGKHKYDRITIPSIFIFCILLVGITAAIFYIKAREESRRYFSVYKELARDNENELG